MRRPFVLAAAASAAAWLPPLLFSLRWDAYSATRDFISELGAAGAPDALAVNASFLVAGLLFVASCAAIARRQGGTRTAVAMTLVSCVGWSYVVAATVPCDSGCPANGSVSQAIHNNAGFLGYLASAAGLLLASGRRAAALRGPAWLAAAAGVLTLASLVAMGAPEWGAIRGAAQRTGEGAIFTWLLVEARAAGRGVRTAGPAPSAPAAD